MICFLKIQRNLIAFNNLERGRDWKLTTKGHDFYFFFFYQILKLQVDISGNLSSSKFFISIIIKMDLIIKL